MQHTPKKNQKGKKRSAFLMATACIGLVASALLKIEYRLFYQLIALLACVLSFEMLNRYYLTTYTYTVDEESFIITKRTGKRTQTVCNLSLQTLLGIEKQTKTKEARLQRDRTYGTPRLRYNYCQSMSPAESYLIFFEFNGKTAEIAFEPDQAMVSALLHELHRKNEFESFED